MRVLTVAWPSGQQRFAVPDDFAVTVHDKGWVQIPQTEGEGRIRVNLTDALWTSVHDEVES